MMRGLPASGKSTYSRKLIDDNPGIWKRISKDDLRNMMDNSKWSKSNEKFVKEVRDLIVRDALRNGYNVIVDDTNLDESHFNRMDEIAGEFDIWSHVTGETKVDRKVEVEIKDFTDVPVEECIRRDKLRAASVGEKVIRDFYNRYLKKEPVAPVWVSTLPTAIVVDIDGTMAIKGDRNIYDYTKVKLDKVNDSVKFVFNGVIKSSPYLKVIFCSGREDSCRQETLDWFQDNDIKCDYLFMRKTGDHRKDAIVKKEIYDAEIKDKFNVMLVLDDRTQVVELWRSLGLPCFQVANGDF